MRNKELRTSSHANRQILIIHVVISTSDAEKSLLKTGPKDREFKDILCALVNDKAFTKLINIMKCPNIYATFGSKHHRIIGRYPLYF